MDGPHEYVLLISPNISYSNIKCCTKRLSFKTCPFPTLGTRALLREEIRDASSPKINTNETCSRIFPSQFGPAFISNATSTFVQSIEINKITLLPQLSYDPQSDENKLANRCPRDISSSLGASQGLLYLEPL